MKAEQKPKVSRDTFKLKSAFQLRDTFFPKSAPL